jgi:hypothetical protein
MFIRIFNLVFFLLYSLHFLNIIFIPNEIRYFMMASYLVINLLGLIQNKFKSNNKFSDNDDFYLMNTTPKKPSPKDPDMVKFMSDLNESIEKKKIEKIKVKNE